MKYDYRQIAKCKINDRNYEVLLVNNEYYQVRCNRNKISNHNSEKAAVKRMLAEANYENTSIFEEEQQPKETEKDIIRDIISLSTSNSFGNHLILKIDKKEAEKIIKKYKLEKDEYTSNGIEFWIPKKQENDNEK